ncbi:MAG: OmpH family outer membrane protein [Desulfurivibrio sp.]|nr:OmpH family outer membrane protein [Desulfurivibrio sp.]
MKRRSLHAMMVVALLITLGLSVQPVAAAEGKIAVVSIQDVLDRSSVARQARRQVEEEVKKQRQKLQQEQAALTEMQQEIETKSSVWSEQVKEERQRELQRRYRDFEELNEDAKAAVERKEQELMEPILEELDAILTELGKKNGYSLIMENSTKGLRSRTGLIYSDENLDIGDQVVEELNKRLE